MCNREIHDLEKKLYELLTQYREEPHHSAISAALQSLESLDPDGSSLKDFLKCKSALPTTLIQLVEARQSGNNNLQKERSGSMHKVAVAKIPIGLLDLIYYCLVNDVFTRMQISEIISKICKISWAAPCVMKILQMGFYFIRYDLDESMSFRLLSLIVESFVAEDSSLDLVARPVVIQATESLLNSITSRDGDQVHDPRVCIFDFIHDTIVLRRNHFASYILLVIIKHPQVDRLPEFISFLRGRFFEICLAVLRSPKLEDSVPIYEAVLKIERSFHHTAHSELDSFYSRLDGVESEFLLKFISCLLKVREEVPESISTLLCKVASSIDLYDAKLEKMVKLLEGVICSAGKRVGLSRRLMEIIFLKVQADSVLDAKIEGSDACANSLLRACLRHCSENDLREVFEAGLKKCGIRTLTDTCVELKDYMGSSWRIYFDACKEYNLDFLQDFTRDQLDAFITGLSDGNLLGLRIFENGHRVLADENNADVLEQLLGKVSDRQVLFAILLKFYNLNTQRRASPVPLDFLRGFFDSNPEHVGDLFLFLSEIICIIDPRDCWSQIFSILMMDDSFYHEKMQIVLCIVQDYLYDLEERHIRMVLCLLEQMMFLGSIGHTSSEVVQNGIFIYKELGKFALTGGRCTVWRDITNFGVRMVQTQDHSTSEVFLKHLFDFFRIGIDKMLDSDLSFVNEAVMSKLYAIREGAKLVLVLNELLQFVTTCSLGIYTTDLVSFLSTVICDSSLASSSPSVSKCTIPSLALECLKVICKKYKTDFRENSMTEKTVSKYKGRKKDRVNSKSSTDQIADSPAISGCAGNFKSEEHIHFSGIADVRLANPDSDKIDGMDQNGLRTVDASLINSRVFPMICASKLSEKNMHRAVVGTLVTAFIYILRNCDLEQYPVVSSILQIIPSFYFSVSEIAVLSKYLRKFVAFSDPYRTEAIDCFVKTCGNSNGGSHCLEILSSWLSKDSKETSLTLIDKISDRISENPENDLTSGLVNFIDYSAQFSGSDEFLEPVLNVISKSKPGIKDAGTFDRLYAFSLKFIIDQLNIPYTAKREGAILGYLSFFDDLLQEFKNAKYLELFVSIIRSNRHYLNLKLRSYEVLFENYSFSEVLLKGELRVLIHDYSRRFLREGFGISNLLTIELVFCLNQISNSKNVELVNSLKDELVDLLIVNDFEIVNSVRKSMKVLFFEG